MQDADYEELNRLLRDAEVFLEQRYAEVQVVIKVPAGDVVPNLPGDMRFGFGRLARGVGFYVFDRDASGREGLAHMSFAQRAWLAANLDVFEARLKDALAGREQALRDAVALARRWVHARSQA